MPNLLPVPVRPAAQRPARPMRPVQNLLSCRVLRTAEHERYCPELEEDIKDCLRSLQHNQMLFDLEIDPELIDQRIYERQALLCRYRYLIGRARALGLHTILAYGAQQNASFC
jgi:hypothetical protein